MTEKPKYETMTEMNFLDLIHSAVGQVLEDVRKGKEVYGVPKLTVEQLDNISYESSFREHRIVFYPEDNRRVVLTITAQEDSWDLGEDE